MDRKSRDNFMGYDIFTQQDIDRYMKDLPQGKSPDLVSMVNYFSHGAISRLSNFLYNKIYEEGEGSRKLVFGHSKHCMCLSCMDWQIIEEGEDGKEKLIDSTEQMQNWVEK
jgi:hypothetical protein